MAVKNFIIATPKTQVTLGSVMLTERSQAQKDPWVMNPFMGHSGKGKLMVTENINGGHLGWWKA